jgi:hypothetical protein
VTVALLQVQDQQRRHHVQRYVRRLLIDNQISGYMVAARKNYDVQTVLYDIVKKPTIKPLATPVEKRSTPRMGFYAWGLGKRRNTRRTATASSPRTLPTTISVTKSLAWTTTLRRGRRK